MTGKKIKGKLGSGITLISNETKDQVKIFNALSSLNKIWNTKILSKQT